MMERNILFRGKSKSGNWVHGDLLHTTQGSNGTERSWIVDLAFHNGGWVAVPRKEMVRPETIGQYTGHHDMHGAAIWEDDIVRLYDSNNDDEDSPYCVVWDDVAAGFAFTSDEFTADFGNFCDFQIEVIGNRWDNPELMEGGTDG